MSAAISINMVYHPSGYICWIPPYNMDLQHVSTLYHNAKLFADYIKADIIFIYSYKVVSGANQGKTVLYCNINMMSPILGRCTSEEEKERHELAKSLCQAHALEGTSLFDFLNK